MNYQPLAALCLTSLKAGEEEDWKKKTRDRGGWKRLSDEAVKKLRAAPRPWQREKEEEREIVSMLPVCDLSDLKYDIYNKCCLNNNPGDVTC